jgi:D-alanine-D-alanine ligase
MFREDRFRGGRAVSQPGHGQSRLRVALIFGGRSQEHDVSVVSARSVAAALDRTRYEMILMAIDRQGWWADPETSRRVLDESGDRADEVLAFEGSARLSPILLDGSIDVAFPILHGPFGEDGTIQGLLEVLDLPFVGCDHYSSASCMDKRTTKRLLAQGGLPTPAWVEVDTDSWLRDSGAAERECLELGLPLFVKPARLGSSVGISKVNHATELEAAVGKAFRYDRSAIVERGLDAREIEIAVLGNSEPRASVPGEVIPGHEFYDYDDKYLDDSCQLLAPAPLDGMASTAAADLAIAAYRRLGCQGMARVDLFVERLSGELWVNEINTIPGFTSISMYPRLWSLSGVEYPALLDELVRLAMERFRITRGQQSPPRGSA